MLKIDRTNITMDVRDPEQAGQQSAAADPLAVLDRPEVRARIREIVLDVLAEEIRALERQGVLR